MSHSLSHILQLLRYVSLCNPLSPQGSKNYLLHPQLSRYPLSSHSFALLLLIPHINKFHYPWLTHPNHAFVSLVCHGFCEGFWPWAITHDSQQPVDEPAHLVPMYAPLLVGGVREEEEKWHTMCIKPYCAKNFWAYVIQHFLIAWWLRPVTISVGRGWWACSFGTDVNPSIFTFISLSICHGYPSHTTCLCNIPCDTCKPSWLLALVGPITSCTIRWRTSAHTVFPQDPRMAYHM